MAFQAFLNDPQYDRLRGIALMVVSTLAFSGMHSTIKFVSADMHPFEIAFFRNFFGLVALAPFFVRHGLAPLKTTRIGLHIGRVSLNIGSMIAFFYAISITPLAEVIALSFAAPVFATFLAIFFFREMVGPARWIAILMGFAGTLVILRPGYEEIALGPVLAVLAAMTWGGAVMIIKSLSRTDSSLTITAYMVIFMTPLSLIPALFVWQWPTWEQLAFLALVGAFGSAGHLTMNQAIKLAPTNVVMPIDFVRLIWVAIIGYFIFAEVPDIFVWIGGAMIFASGLWIAHAENRKRKETPDGSGE
ncbi:MAG: DMT family transporter [Alphaproteobacteria bacterium]